MHAIVTLRSTTGWIISRIARSTATGTVRFKIAPVTVPDPKEGLIVTYAAKLGMTVCCWSWVLASVELGDTTETKGPLEGLAATKAIPDAVAGGSPAAPCLSSELLSLEGVVERAEPCVFPVLVDAAVAPVAVLLLLLRREPVPAIPQVLIYSLY